MSDAHQGLIEAQCLGFNDLKFRHYTRWSFELLRAPVLLLDIDSSLGREALSMLKSFRLRESSSSQDPILLCFSADDYEAMEWASDPYGFKVIPKGREADCCKHLREVLASLEDNTIGVRESRNPGSAAMASPNSEYRP